MTQAEFIAAIPERLRARFVAKVKFTSTCWEWTAARSWNNYGQFGVRHSQIKYTHRLAFTWAVGEIAPRVTLDHLCRNRLCLRPDHLEPVSLRENLLRGNTRTAANAAKTSCPQGHPYAGSNLMVNSDGHRRCRECKRLCRARYAAQARGAACP